MKLFLTSSIGGSYKENGIRIPSTFDESNNLLNLLKEHIPINSKCLILSSDLNNEEMNNSFKALFTKAFKISNLPLSKLDTSLH